MIFDIIRMKRVADEQIDFAGGLNHWDMNHARKYAIPPMPNILDSPSNDEYYC